MYLLYLLQIMAKINPLFSQDTCLEMSPPIGNISQDSPFPAYVQGWDECGWLDKVEKKQPEKEKKLSKCGKTKKCKCINQSSTFILKNDQRKGRFLIKIDIEAFDNSDNEHAVSAQYIMTDQYDEVMDAAQCVVRKIFKKMCEQ
ncbi:hypothetical protein JYU34_003130 [Plutella xylostella]|uniref:Uncharacterized protein n=1 Tax=Plutella xylostella TaxID=51655 RepID=A0ABQ7QZ78_PLUXY|nr:hypothetical protein JYU34_012800 [Plutella xylostella]KAG7310357.1 hypothetical protein JYU34_003130 [Plutella xylostella]